MCFSICLNEVVLQLSTLLPKREILTKRIPVLNIIGRRATKFLLARELVNPNVEEELG